MNRCKNCYYHNEVCHCKLLENKQNGFAYYVEISERYKIHYPDKNMPFSNECLWNNLGRQVLCPKFVEK